MLDDALGTGAIDRHGASAHARTAPSGPLNADNLTMIRASSPSAISDRMAIRPSKFVVCGAPIITSFGSFAIAPACRQPISRITAAAGAAGDTAAGAGAAAGGRPDFTGFDDVGDGLADRHDLARLGADAGQHTGGPRLHLDVGLVGLDFQERVALFDDIAVRLQPAGDLAGFLGHFVFGHDDGCWHGVFVRA